MMTEWRASECLAEKQPKFCVAQIAEKFDRQTASGFP
jgi:hypothetical protein